MENHTAQLKVRIWSFYVPHFSIFGQDTAVSESVQLKKAFLNISQNSR